MNFFFIMDGSDHSCDLIQQAFRIEMDVKNEIHLEHIKTP